MGRLFLLDTCRYLGKLVSMSAFLFRRYVWLLDQVSRGNKKFKHISNAWEKSPLNDRPGEPLPKKTFHNHIKAIEEMFDIRIRCQRQGGYVYVLEGADGGKLSDTQETLLHQLRLSNAVTSNAQLSPRIILDKSIAYRYLSPLLMAMDESQRVKIYYWRIGDSRDRRAEFTFEPYFLKQFSKEWFIVGRVVEDDTIRILLFDHIRMVEPLDEYFADPESFDIKAFIDNTLSLLDEDGNVVAESEAAAIDDRELFATLRFRDTIYRRSTYGSFIPDEKIE